MKQDLKTLRNQIEGIRNAMFTTIDESGHLRSRPMATSQVTDDGFIWFVTWKDSPKIGEVQRSNQVNVSYSEPGSDQWVSVSGPVELVDEPGRIQELWDDRLKSDRLHDWFPKGLTDPDLLLMKVRVERAEYWDKKTSRLVPIVGTPAERPHSQKLDRSA